MIPTDTQSRSVAANAHPAEPHIEVSPPYNLSALPNYDQDPCERPSKTPRLKGLSFKPLSFRLRRNRVKEKSQRISKSYHTARPSTSSLQLLDSPSQDKGSQTPSSPGRRDLQETSTCTPYSPVRSDRVEQPLPTTVPDKCPTIPRFSWQTRASTIEIFPFKNGDLEIGSSSWAKQFTLESIGRYKAPKPILEHSTIPFNRDSSPRHTATFTRPRRYGSRKDVSNSSYEISKRRHKRPESKTAIMGEAHLHSGYASPARSDASGPAGDYGASKRSEEPPLPTSNPHLTSPSRTAGINASADTPPQNLSGLVCNVYRTTGNEPPALVGASTTIIGDRLFVFGGRRLSHRRPHLTRRFYELDLVRRHWTRLETHGRPPSPRYFHSMCPLGDTKLVCYGGMAPVAHRSQDSTHQTGGSNPNEPGITVMSDVHIYDIPTRTWTFIPTTDAPPGRYAHCAAILPSSAVFVSATAPLYAIQHNPASSNPNQGSIGVTIDGRGGAEMVIVGGQDSASKYIESICVFNLRSLRWTTSTPLGKSCGAYRSVVAPLIGISASQIGPQERNTREVQSPRPGSRKASATDEGDEAEAHDSGCSMLLYSNYNFLDVKLELQIRHPDGLMEEKRMRSVSQMPPGLRFPNGGVVNNHLVISGTFLTSSKQEYALWALNLKTLVWSRVDVGLSSVSPGSNSNGGSLSGVFSSGSWNRGMVWRKRNSFIVLGNRRRNLGEDYHHRRLNFTHFCVVELEAFGLYDNPRNNAYQAVPLRSLPEPSLSTPTLGTQTLQQTDFDKIGGLSCGALAAEKLGLQAQQMREMCDMDFLAIGGERIPVNSHMVAWRWGPYFHQLIAESNARDRERAAANNHGSSSPRPGMAQRYSNVTITPSMNTVYSSSSTVVPDSINGVMSDTASINTTIHAPSEMSNQSTLTANTTSTLRPQAPFFSTHPITKYSRLLYFPHTLLTLRALTHYLYTGVLPPPTSRFCTPQILCSLLQIARPYRVDGLLEATVQRLHEILDARNTAAVFNAAAMAAGGGEATPFIRPHRPAQGNALRSQYSSPFGAIEENSNEESAARRSRDLQNPGLAIMHLTNGSGGSVARALHGQNGLRIDESDEGFLGGALHGGGGVVEGSRHTSFSDPRKNSADANAAAGTTGGAGGGNSSNSRGGGDNEVALSNSSRSTSTTSMSDLEMVTSQGSQGQAGPSLEQEIWTGGEPSQVIGLQKRGLRGLMEGRKLRERDQNNTNNNNNNSHGNTSGGGGGDGRQQQQRQSSSAAGGLSGGGGGGGNDSPVRASRGGAGGGGAFTSNHNNHNSANHATAAAHHVNDEAAAAAAGGGSGAASIPE